MPGRNPIRLLIADDHLVVRMGLRSMVDTQDCMVVVAEAANGREAIRLEYMLPSIWVPEAL